MSEDVDRTKVLQTTKVRTTLKSDLSWIHRKKTTEDTKESTETTEEAQLPSMRQLSYVLMTTKKFEPEVATTSSPKEKTSSDNELAPSSDNGLQNGKHSEPASPEPTAAETATEKKNDVEPPNSNESVEDLPNLQVNGDAAAVDSNHVTKVSTVEEITVNGCSETTNTETTKETHLPEQESSETIENNTTQIEESVSNMVPDILAESVFKSPSPQENKDGQCAKVTSVFDMLSDTLVEPILNIETKEAEGNPSSEMLAEEASPNSTAETLPNLNVATEQPTTEQSLLPKVSELNTSSDVLADSNPSTESLSTSKEEDMVDSGSSSSEMSATVKGSEAAEEEEQEISAVLSDVPQDNAEPQSTSTKEDMVEPGTTSVDVTVVENTMETVKDEVGDEKAPDISVVLSDLSQDNAETQELQSSPAKETAEPEVTDLENSLEQAKVETNDETVGEAKASDIAVALPDVAQNKAESEESQSTPSKEDIVEAATSIADASAVENNVELVKACEESPEEPESSSVSASSSDVHQASQSNSEVESNVEPAASETADVPEQPSTKDDSAVIDENVVTPENLSIQDTADGSPSETKDEVIADQNVQESKIEESAHLETGSTKSKDAPNVNELVPELEINATPSKESPEPSNTVEASVKEITKESTIECPIQTPALTEINQDETYKAEPAVVVPENATSEAEETNNSATADKTVGDNVTETKIEAIQAEAEVESTPEVSASEALFDIHDALETIPSSDQNKAEAETTVKESDEPKDSKEEPITDNSEPHTVEEEETISVSYIMRDGKEVCSHCDQFIGLIKLTFSYPPMYLHPECLKCGVCTKPLGDLLTPMFEHKQLIYCSGCYDKVYSLN